MCKPIYANSLTITANEAKNEFVFTFNHKYPVVGVNGAVDHDQEETVAAVIVNDQLAKAIPGVMSKILGEQVD